MAGGALRLGSATVLVLGAAVLMYPAGAQEDWAFLENAAVSYEISAGLHPVAQ